MNNYFVYHLHSQYSNATTNIDSISAPEDYIKRAQELGMKGLCFSEHGNIFGWYLKKQAIEKAGMKYVHGEEFYLTETLSERVRDNFHCVLIAKNYEGFKELNRLVTSSFNREDNHFYYAPRITIEQLFSTSDNIIITSACFRAGSKVLTKQGLKNIEHIKRGDIVLNRYGAWEPVNFATKRKYSGIGYKIKTDYSDIVCTEDHKFLSCTQNSLKYKKYEKLRWVKAKDLCEQHSSQKDILISPFICPEYTNKDIIERSEWYGAAISSKRKRKVRIKKSIKITPEIVRMLGLFLGDGHISIKKNNRVGISFNESEFDIYWDSFIRIASEHIGISWSISRISEQHKVEIYSSSSDLVDLFYYIFGNVNASTKHIPKRIINISKELDQELIFGYYLADGYFRKRSACCGEAVSATVSEDLSIGMRKLFESIKIPVSFSKIDSHISKDGTTHKTAWYLYTSSATLGGVDKTLPYTHEDVKNIFNNAREDLERKYVEIDGVLYRKVNIRKKDKIQMDEDVYCLNVDSHSFCCNGVVVHNCLGGVLNNGEEKLQEKFIRFFTENKHRCFLEIQHHNVEEQKKYNKKLWKIYEKTTINLISGTDTHALNETHLIGRKKLQEGKSVHFANEENWDLSFKSYDELVEAYRIQNSLPEEIYLQAIENTNVLLDLIEPFDVDVSFKYPKIYDNPSQTLRDKINEGYKENKYIKQYPLKELREKINEEVNTFETIGQTDFMLLERYLKEWEIENDIIRGPGRGSVTGSIVAYILGLTEMDSIKFDLNFFRFSSPARVSLGDIDCDYSNKDRDKVKDFLLRDKMKLPKIRSSEIITFNTIALKGAIKDIGRALKMDLEEVQGICNAVVETVENGEKRQTISDDYREKYKELFKFSDIVNGTIVSIGTHPSGVLICDRNIEEEIGLCSIASTPYPVSCLNMKELDGQNWVKLDILGLDNIALITETCKLAGIERLTPDNTPLDDVAVWNSIREDTTAIFQYESASAQAFAKKFMSPKTIEEAKKRNENFSWIKWFSFGNGLIRPACASFRDDVASGKFYTNGLEELDAFLSQTFGHLTMQEDIMKFLVKFCGYSDAESDVVRRAIAKKKGTAKLLPEIKAGFIKCTHETYGVPLEKCEAMSDGIIQVIQDASLYGFSWNHSDAYSCLGYICGYLRHYYPLEFLTCALNVFSDKEEKSQKIVKYAQKMGFKIEPPKFRKSVEKYIFEPGTKTIYKGLQSIKYVNEQSTMELYDLRMMDFPTFTDLLITIWEDTKVNTRQMRVLISLDFFSEFGKNQKLMNIFEHFIVRYKKTYVPKTKSARIEEIKGYEDILDDVSLPISEQIQAEMEFMGYVSYRAECNKRYCYVIGVDEKYTPRATLYCMLNGNTIECKIDKKFYKSHKFKTNSMIFTDEFELKPDWTFSDGKYVRKGTSSYVLKKYHTVEFDEFDKILLRTTSTGQTEKQEIQPKTSYL